jgi:type IV pilus assembly protein PilC
MYGAGLGIARCLETLEEQTENPSFARVIGDIRGKIEAGSGLEEAFAAHRALFSDFFLGMLSAGESGGKLATALEMSAQYLEKQAELRRKVTGAFAYPVVVTVTCVGVVGFLLMFVVPVFSKLYRQLNVQLPLPTQVLVNLSVMFREWWWAVGLGIVGAVVIVKKVLEHPTVGARLDDFKLNMPLLGRLNRMIAVSKFIRTFAMLASVGVPLVRALEVASVVAHNYRVCRIAESLQEAVEAGHPVAGSLKKHDLFPPMITQLATSGEEAGVLCDMLNKGVDFLDKDIERTINAVLVKLEPALTVVMGLIVAFLLMGVYLPMFDYMSHLE